MSKPKDFLRALAMFAAASLALSIPAAFAKDFSYDEKTNAEIAKKLRIPIFFAVPGSARSSLPKNVELPDRMIDFKHPDAKGKGGDIGLRLVVAKRAGMAQRLGKSGLIQTGDIMLTVRPEWGGGGPYPNIQMGISHTGIAYVKDGVLHNIDNPMDAEFLGAGYRADLTSPHYSTLNLIHIIRPRKLTDAQRANILEWATRLNSNAPRIYPSQISFNSDYNAPKFKPGQPITFVKHLGQSALGQKPTGSVGMFCSEFAWSLLALRNCDPGKSGDGFKGASVPSCAEPVMKTMQVTGDYIRRRSRYSYSGLADGPLLVIDAMKLPAAERDQLIHSVFIENPKGFANMSVGHRKVATDMKPKFAPLEKYYLGAYHGWWGQSWEARLIGRAFNNAVPENYSPTSFLINTLLPASNANRTMDYVASILIE